MALSKFPGFPFPRLSPSTSAFSARLWTGIDGLARAPQIVLKFYQRFTEGFMTAYLKNGGTIARTPGPAAQDMIKKMCSDAVSSDSLSPVSR
jgi:hypothetical protein